MAMLHEFVDFAQCCRKMQKNVGASIQRWESLSSSGAATDEADTTMFAPDISRVSEFLFA